MTHAEYVQYEESFKSFMEREGITNLSMISAPEGEATEPYFSWRPCDCCNRALGGNRMDCNGYNPTTKGVQDYSICEDCVYYAEYGHLDDTTMLDVEESKNNPEPEEDSE